MYTARRALPAPHISSPCAICTTPVGSGRGDKRSFTEPHKTKTALFSPSSSFSPCLFPLFFYHNVLFHGNLWIEMHSSYPPCFGPDAYRSRGHFLRPIYTTPCAICYIRVVVEETTQSKAEPQFPLNSPRPTSHTHFLFSLTDL
jgi:hypothetical protein